MLKRALITSELGCCALAICSIVALSPAQAADFPLGKYSAPQVPFSVSFDDKGHFHVSVGETLMVKGSYSVNAGQMKLTDTQGPWACTRAAEQTGTYAWKYENAVLTLSKVADKCPDRVKSLINLAWKRQM